ncbi:hypothetical protein [Sunxiuqinia indica]|uniref:hypothetical protein n=1 Tax=Sunxiuqinia indica TaxID=2692584 RepID=UPI00135770E5|nr:hypothetical protein [Sunxiuqinia indica]
MSNLTPDEIKRLKVAKVKCEKEMLFFTRYFFKAIHKRKFMVGPHHVIIANALERVMRGECKKLIINIAPRFGKTELAVINFIAYALALNPSSNFMHLSYSDDLVLENSEKIRDIIESDEYKTLFGNVQLKKDSKAKKKWKTEAGGSIYVASAAGQVTGFGAGKVDDDDTQTDIQSDIDILNFIDGIDDKRGFNGAIIIDDPIKPADTDYTTRREKVNQRFENTIRNRVNSRNTPIVIIMQRLHPEDLCGYLMESEPDEWEVIKLPVVWDKDSIKTAQKYGFDISGIKIGDPLWPFKLNHEEIAKEKKKARLKNTTHFETQFMQDPQPKEGLCFAKSELQYLDDIKFDRMMEQPGIELFYGDTADEGEDNYSMPMAKIINGKVYIHDVIFAQDNLSAIEPRIIVAVGDHSPVKVFIEANNAGSLHIKDLRKNIPAYQNVINKRLAKSGKSKMSTKVHGVKNTTNKLIRILSQEGFIKDHFVFRAEIVPDSEYGKFMKQIWRYLKNGKEKRDDAPDSIAGLAYVVRTFYGQLFN